MKRFHVASSLLTIVLLGCCAVGVAACGGDQPEATGDQLSGAIRIDGSSTVYPITEAVAEEFMREYPGVRVTVGVSGTGGGFAKFLRGETDISDASRPISESELAQAEQNNIEFIELPVSYDGITVVVNPQSDWVECLTTEELRRIWEPNSEVDNWSDIRPDFPDRELHLYGPGTDSGTYDYFTEAIMGEEGASRADFTASEDDNVLVQGVAGDPNALGFFGMAYYENNREQLKAIEIDSGDGNCVAPSAETVGNGTYRPLARPEFIYVNAGRADDPAVETFVRYYIEQAPELVPEVGYVPLPPEAYALVLERFQHRTTGSMFTGTEEGTGMSMVERLQRSAGPAATPADTVAADTAAAE